MLKLPRDLSVGSGQKERGTPNTNCHADTSSGQGTAPDKL